MDIPTGIHWPSGIDEAVFLKEYWQKKPLLIRQAFPHFETPLPADELAGLSLEAGTTPRIITQDDSGHYALENGPFDDDRFATLDGNNWSLLVTDVEKHIPQFSAYLKPFTFLPSWRIDDLMISYAPVGASVGAHVDEYDVFLLQASGIRQWSIDSRPDAQHTWVPDAALKLIDGFDPTDSWELEAGDMLYLPPGIGHHGVASAEPCTTWSIGFRAPAITDVVMRLSELIAETMPETRYTDGPLTPAVSGEITQEALQRIQRIWTEATTIEPAQFANLLGTLLTESGVAEYTEDGIEDSDLTDDELSLYKAPYTQLAWHSASDASLLKPADPVSLFVNGDCFYCSKAMAIALCGTYPIDALQAQNASDKALIRQLLKNGCLLID